MTEAPEPSAVPARRPRRAVRAGRETGPVSGASADERSAGWSEDRTDGAENANDERLRRDVPPHW